MHYANGHAYRSPLHHELHELLCAEAAKRDQRQGLSWIGIERQAMCDAVNEHRSARGKAPLPLSEIARVEAMACGHVDYGTKFALYCTELVEE